ncbi:MAG: ABC transporter ATP-binding protein [Acidimicrobiales bacterium]
MLQITDLTKRFGEVQAADGVTLSVPKGRIVGFVGPNGAGKSTTMRSIFGLVDPDGGTITWDGRPLGPDDRSRFGYMPEQRGLYAKMGIVEQTAYFARLKGRSASDATARATELLTELGLGDRLDDPLEKLSHGNQQRVQLAVSLVHEPELAVLDEPFNGLDPLAVARLEEFLATLAANGTAVLFSSHQLDLVEKICQDVVIIAAGRVRAAGSLDELRSSSGRRHVTIRVERPLEPLSDLFAGQRLSSASTREVVVDIDDESELDALLATARSAGQVSVFSYEPPSLGDIFEEVAR